jgi:Tol biopolymer transport system component
MRWNLPQISIGLFLTILALFGCSGREQATDLLEGIDVGCILQSESSGSRLGLIRFGQNGAVIEQTNIMATCPSWSPEYKQLAYAEQGRIHIFSLDRMTEEVIETDFHRLSNPVWSLDGVKLAFAAQRNLQRSGLDIWILDLSTQELELVIRCANSSRSTDSCESPIWLPDGRLGYFRHVKTQANVEILDITSQDTEVIAEGLIILLDAAPFGTMGISSYGLLNTNLAWSPHGSRVAFVGGKGKFPDDAGIYVLDLASQEISEVTPSKVWADSPMWLDDTYILFRSRVWTKNAGSVYAHERERYEAQNLAIVNTDSRKIIPLTDIEPPSAFGLSCPFWVPESISEQLSSYEYTQ